MKPKKKFNIYTDLAVEAREMTPEAAGVLTEENKEEAFDITVTWVKIVEPHTAEVMGKPMGNYLTIEAPGLKENSIEVHERIISILAEKIHELCELPPDAQILIVGLGNWNVTPDALGPKVVSKTLVTRHIIESVPEEIDESVRPVSAISPGVMGITGIETQEIIQGICEKSKPDLVIAIDALAARKTSRINATIQLSDTGISPGAGMGNKRKILNEKTLGVPVIAIGVPTVVDAATLVNDTMDKMLEDMISATKKGSEFYQLLNDMDTEEKYSLITQILDPYTENMFVTPKEVDAVIDRISGIIANSINIALHPGITREDINRYMN